jgi:MinD-like ATPase involved in chromosome partitioning or flagellar assembly
MDGPAIAIVRSPREWALSLHRYVADYGGAVVRARPLEERQALEEEYSILLVDDASSFLTHRLIQELHRQGRRIIGVYDNDDIIGGIAAGRERMEQMGLDATIEASASPEDFLRLIQSITPVEQPNTDVDELIAEFRATQAFGDEFDDLEPVSGKYGSGEISDTGESPVVDSDTDEELVPVAPVKNVSKPKARGGKLTVVLSASGGAGSTEIAIELARIVRARGEVGVLVDADDISPAIAQRLGLPLHPNIRSAIDAVEHHVGRLAECVIPAEKNQTTVLTGLPHPKDWMTLRPEEVLAVCEELARVCHQVIINVGSQLDDLAGIGGIDRFGVARILIEEADQIVLVGWASPVGIARILDRAAEIQSLSETVPVHIVLNHAPVNNYMRGELLEEMQRTFVPKSLHFVPFDKKVEDASWSGRFVAGGLFANAVAEIAMSALGSGTMASTRRKNMKRAG